MESNILSLMIVTQLLQKFLERNIEGTEESRNSAVVLIHVQPETNY